MAIEVVRGDATAPSGEAPRIIVHICNDIGGWGAGFVLALSRRWKQPEAAYRAWYATKDPPFALGEVQLVEVEPGLYVANMIGQEGIRARDGVPPIRYDAVERCLGKVAEMAAERGASVHMPRIGCGLAGGEWSEIEARIERTLVAASIPTTVYDWSPD